MGAVRVVGAGGSWSKPGVVVEMRRHCLKWKIGFSNPVEFPIKAGVPAESDFIRTVSDEAAIDGFFHFTCTDTGSVEVTFIAKPSVKAEGDVCFLNGFDHLLAFADGAGHWLLSPDVFPSIGSGDGHVGMPVRRGAGVDDIDVITRDDLAEISVHRGIFIAHFDCLIGALFHPLRIDIAESENAPRHFEVGVADSAAT